MESRVTRVLEHQRINVRSINVDTLCGEREVIAGIVVSGGPIRCLRRLL